MELKLFISILVDMAISILIVPLWNWNMVDVFIVQNGFSSNCTFMELKSRIDDGLEIESQF